MLWLAPCIRARLALGQRHRVSRDNSIRRDAESNPDLTRALNRTNEPYVPPLETKRFKQKVSLLHNEDMPRKHRFAICNTKCLRAYCLLFWLHTCFLDYFRFRNHLTIRWMWSLFFSFYCVLWKSELIPSVSKNRSLSQSIAFKRKQMTVSSKWLSFNNRRHLEPVVLWLTISSNFKSDTDPCYTAREHSWCLNFLGGQVRMELLGAFTSERREDTFSCSFSRRHVRSKAVG